MTSHFFRALLCAAFLAAFSPQLRAAHSALEPAPRNEQGWKDRHASINKKAAEAGKKCELVFIGDSITQGWEGEGKKVWADHYTKYHAVNLGIGGDRTQHVLWRLENGNLEGLSPKAAVVMIGTNNSGHCRKAPAKTSGNENHSCGDLSPRRKSQPATRKNPPSKPNHSQVG